MVLSFGVLCISGEGRCEATGVVRAASPQTLAQQGRPVSAPHKALSKVWSLAVRFLVWVRHLFTPLGTVLTLFGLLLLVYVVRELFRDVLIFEPLTVPKRFEEAGLTSGVMANRIGAALDELETSIKSVVMKKDVLGYLYSETTPEIEIPGTKIGLKTIVELFRNLLRVHPKHICGDVVFPVQPADATPGWRSTKEPVTVTIYLKRGRSELQRISAVVADWDQTALVRRSAEISLELANPYLFAALLMSRKEYSRAIEVARKVTESPSEGVFRRKAERNLKKSGFYIWGLILLTEKQNAEAAVKFEQAIQQDPEFAFAYLCWGNALYEQNQNEKAVKKYQKATEIDPKYAEAYYGWGNALLSSTKYKDAAAQYEKATVVKPDYSDAYNNWGQALHESGEYREAIVKYKRAAELAPTASVYLGWGNSLYSLKEYAEAAVQYQRSSELDPTYADAFGNWALALTALGRNAEAQEKLAKAKELRESR
jgi:tetratricopeptide (TPR) repeat protein